ncbi:MAG: permease, partial [Anaerolineales bacterium]|nr:permease [Anaerolineales bacterium]
YISGMAQVEKQQSADVEKAGKDTAVSNLARNFGRILGAIVILLLLIGLFPNLIPSGLNEKFQTFVTIFLGIFIEAVPFLLAGSLVSGLIEVFVDKASLARFVPKRAVPAAFVGAMLGFAFPVCECGVVPVTRRLYQKGLPVSVGIAFLLSAPVINPVVLVSTYVAFGWGPVLIGRFAFSILIAFTVGLIFQFAPPEEIILPQTDEGHDHDHFALGVGNGRSQRFWQAFTIAGDDFIDMVRYLIIGSMLAATMQTFVPQATLINFGSGPVTSVVAMMVLAFVLSICSTVDAFLALSFVNTFTTGSILSFLVFGPMVDIKSALMFLGVFRRRVVLYLILLPLLLTMLITVFINLNLGW